jgi:hypothetical protein
VRRAAALKTLCLMLRYRNDVSTIIGLRDRALIALLIYSFARISAALQMDVEGERRLSASRPPIISMHRQPLPFHRPRQAPSDAHLQVPDRS